MELWESVWHRVRERGRKKCVQEWKRGQAEVLPLLLSDCYTSDSYCAKHSCLSGWCQFHVPQLLFYLTFTGLRRAFYGLSYHIQATVIVVMGILCDHNLQWFLLATEWKKQQQKHKKLNMSNVFMTFNVINIILSQLTNAVLMSQRHKIESSGFLTIDVLCKEKKEGKACKIM